MRCCLWFVINWLSPTPVHFIFGARHSSPAALVLLRNGVNISAYRLAYGKLLNCEEKPEQADCQASMASRVRTSRRFRRTRSGRFYTYCPSKRPPRSRVCGLVWAIDSFFSANRASVLTQPPRLFFWPGAPTRENVAYWPMCPRVHQRPTDTPDAESRHAGVCSAAGLDHRHASPGGWIRRGATHG